MIDYLKVSLREMTENLKYKIFLFLFVPFVLTPVAVYLELRVLNLHHVLYVILLLLIPTVVSSYFFFNLLRMVLEKFRLVILRDVKTSNVDTVTIICPFFTAALRLEVLLLNAHHAILFTTKIVGNFTAVAVCLGAIAKAKSNSDTPCSP